MATLWGGLGSQAVKSEVPYFPEATRLFSLAPHLLTAEFSGNLTQPYREHVWIYARVNAIAQSITRFSDCLLTLLSTKR